MQSGVAQRIHYTIACSPNSSAKMICVCAALGLSIASAKTLKVFCPHSAGYDSGLLHRKPRCPQGSWRRERQLASTKSFRRSTAFSSINDSPRASIRSASGGLESKTTFWARLVNKFVVTQYLTIFTSTRFVVLETDLRFLTLGDTDGHFPVGVGIGHKWCV